MSGRKSGIKTVPTKSCEALSTATPDKEKPKENPFIDHQVFAPFLI